MDDKSLDQIHEAAKALQVLIGKYTNGDAIVMWGSNYKEKDVAWRTCSGISIGDNVDAKDLEHLVFCLLGRSYGMIDFD